VGKNRARAFKYRGPIFEVKKVIAQVTAHEKKKIMQKLNVRKNVHAPENYIFENLRWLLTLPTEFF